MMITKVTLRIRRDKAAMYESTFAQLRQRVLTEEPGCKFFELCRDPEGADQYHVIEAYADADAVTAHVSTPYYEETARVFVECLKGDHMSEIEARGLRGREMYQVVKGIQFERLESI